MTKCINFKIPFSDQFVTMPVKQATLMAQLIRDGYGGNLADEMQATLDRHDCDTNLGRKRKSGPCTPTYATVG